MNEPLPRLLPPTPPGAPRRALSSYGRTAFRAFLCLFLSTRVAVILLENNRATALAVGLLAVGVLCTVAVLHLFTLRLKAARTDPDAARGYWPVWGMLLLATLWFGSTPILWLVDRLRGGRG